MVWISSYSDGLVIIENMSNFGINGGGIVIIEKYIYNLHGLLMNYIDDLS